MLTGLEAIMVGYLRCTLRTYKRARTAQEEILPYTTQYGQSQDEGDATAKKQIPSV